MMLSPTSVRVAGITIGAVPDKSAHTGMFRCRRRLRVANGTLEHRIVGWIRVAVGAYTVCRTMVCRKPGMVECGARPGGGAVAGFTCRRETGGCMARIRSAVIVGRMACITTGILDRIILTYMTSPAVERNMGAGQLKICCAVIELTARPDCCRVTSRAIMAEVRSGMVRISWSLIIGGVTLVTVRVLYRIVLVHMTGSAIERNVCPRKLEVRRAVVELTAGPDCH